MSNFPLYDQLSKDISQKELTIKQKDKFMILISDIDINGYELIYALIRVYQLEKTEESSSFKLPYEGKYVNKDMMFDLNQLPTELKQILFKFLQIHTEKMKEDSFIQETRLDI
jgi:hypothetical protein